MSTYRMTLEQAAATQELALAILTDHLEAVGNVLSDLHKAALTSLLVEMTELAAGRLAGRRCFSLGTGCGKTSAVIAWIAALHRLGLDQVAVSVSASKIEALCDLKRQLIAHGIPEGLVGLKHSDPSASMPSTGDSDRLYQLVTHARVRGGTNQPLFLEHRGQSRALMVYDESLIRSDAEVVGERVLRMEVAAFKEYVRGLPAEPRYQALIEFLDRAVADIGAALMRCREDASVFPIIEIDAPCSVTLDGYQAILGRSASWGSIRRFLDIVAGPLRLMLTAQAEGILKYQISVPPSLTNVMVLDASYPIRELERLDPTITDCTPSFVREVKRFDRVTVHQMKHASGRDATAGNFTQSRASERTMSREIVRLVEATPRNKSILIFTFKAHPGQVNIPDMVWRDLAAAGISRADKTTEGKARINVLTWGDETSLNHYSHCEVVILAGILHLPQLQVASQVVAQLDELTMPIGQKQVNSVCDSEMAHCVYQAISRGACRVMDNGQAKPMSVYLFHHKDNLRDALEVVMPGIVWRSWLPTFVAEDRGHSKVDVLAMRIQTHIDTLPETQKSVRTRELRVALGVTSPDDGARKLFTRAVDKVCLAGYWVHQRCGLVRMGEMFA